MQLTPPDEILKLHIYEMKITFIDSWGTKCEEIGANHTKNYFM